MEKNRMLFETIFKKDLTDNDAVDYLEKLTAEHPYFSAAQFYLLQLSSKQHPDYKKQARKTAALFNNNYWLNFQLIEAGMSNSSTEGEEKNIAIVPEPVVLTTAVEEPVIQSIAGQEEPGSEIETEVNIPEPFTAAATQQEEVIDENEAPAINNNIEAPEAEQVIPVEETPIDSAAPVITAPTTIDATAGSANEEVASPVTASEITAPETGNDFSGVISSEDTIEEKQDMAGPVTPAISSAISEAKEMNIAPIIPAINDQVTAGDLLFEPLHTSDYFASVGIKLSEEEKTQDKLGKQLKSFTDWLKTMKRTHAEQLAQVSKPAYVEAAATEGSIQKLAENSNRENDIVTEAMADVLFQQGRQDKGIEILEKLSLLNPTKSAYFAAKINQIKEK